MNNLLLHVIFGNVFLIRNINYITTEPEANDLHYVGIYILSCEDIIYPVSVIFSLQLNMEKWLLFDYNVGNTLCIQITLSFSIFVASHKTAFIT